MSERMIPQIRGQLRHKIVEVSDEIRRASGILINGRRIKSLVFTTDVAIIRNCNADATIAVYPFTPQPSITHALMTAAEMPVFCGVGGGTTRGSRVVDLALDAEFQGAMGVVVNAPTPNDTIEALRKKIDIPIVITVVKDSPDVADRLSAGAQILNVSGAAETPQLVRSIRERLPDAAIIATGGPNIETIIETVRAGANAITYTPPTAAQLFKSLMEKYRAE